MTLPSNPLSARGALEGQRAELARMRDKTIAEVAAGRCRTFDDYRWCVGLIEGLNLGIQQVAKALDGANKPDQPEGIRAK